MLILSHNMRLIVITKNMYSMTTILSLNILELHQIFLTEKVSFTLRIWIRNWANLPRKGLSSRVKERCLASSLDCEEILNYLVPKKGDWWQFSTVWIVSELFWVSLLMILPSLHFLSCQKSTKSPTFPSAILIRASSSINLLTLFW